MAGPGAAARMARRGAAEAGSFTGPGPSGRGVRGVPMDGFLAAPGRATMSLGGRQALPATLAALQELAGADAAARRSLCRSLLRGARLGLRDQALVLFGFAALARWHAAQAAPRRA